MTRKEFWKLAAIDMAKAAAFVVVAGGVVYALKRSVR